MIAYPTGCCINELAARIHNADVKVPKQTIHRDIFDWGDMPQSSKEMCDLIIYELHVRGFTRHHTSGVANPGTFDGLKEKIPYLKELGINAVELMPIFEFDEMEDARVVDGVQLYNYWGYNTVSFFAPNTGYTAEDRKSVV